MSDPVSVPLSRLRVMPSVGAPILWEHEPDRFLRGMFGGFEADRPRRARVWWDGEKSESFEAKMLALDLSAPTSARIDGATVAATLLAEAAGLDVSRGVCWFADRYDPLDKGRAAVTVRATTGSAIRRYSDPTDATDPRAILAAVLVAVLGVDRE